MPSNIETQRFAAKANIFRYQKLLATYLTEEERRFVERRLEEEKLALQHIAEGVTAGQSARCTNHISQGHSRGPSW
jgi:hypothetical protein